jgi:hypothetical protein
LAQYRIGSKQPSVDLDRVRWRGEQTFRMLSYYFAVRWNLEKAGQRIMYALRDFAVPPDRSEHPEVLAPGVPPLYSIVRSRSGDSLYHLLYGEGTMRSAANLGTLLAPLFLHINAQTLRQSSDFLIIHAGSVSTPAREGVLLPARSGGGKTTLVTALVRAGFQYLSDEGGAVDPVSGMLYPYPRAITLKMGHANVFPELCGPLTGPDWSHGCKWIHPADIRPGAVGVGPFPIRFVVAHEYRPGAATELTPITSAEGAMELLTNSLNLPRWRSRALPLVARVAREAQCYRMVSGSLDEEVRTIIELTGRRQKVAAKVG